MADRTAVGHGGGCERGRLRDRRGLREAGGAVMDLTAPEPRPSPALRCAYCHGAATGAAPCAGCGTLIHDGCRVESGGCPTLGCAGAVVRARESSTAAPRDLFSRPGAVRVAGWLLWFIALTCALLAARLS
ncbi:MAG: hypothetical protein KF878_28245 [Planctomycetes bacterium]|nr:hypothetical protein [Planctomycetota bacterium]